MRNPSFKVNSVLLSCYCVVALERLSVEVMGLIMRRAVDAMGIRLLPAVTAKDGDGLASAPHQSDSSGPLGLADPMHHLE